MFVVAVTISQHAYNVLVPELLAALSVTSEEPETRFALLPYPSLPFEVDQPAKFHASYDAPVSCTAEGRTLGRVALLLPDVLRSTLTEVV
jgi:hypothetical protein